MVTDYFITIPSVESYDEATIPTTSDDSVEENFNFKKKFKKSKEESIGQLRELLSEIDIPSVGKLSNHDIEEYLKALIDGQVNLKKILTKLPADKLQALSDSIKREEQLNKDRSDIWDQLDNLLQTSTKNDLTIEGHRAQPIFQKLIEASINDFEASIVRIKNDRNPEIAEFQEFQVKLFQKMELAFLECSTQEQKRYQTALNALLRLLESSIKETKKRNQLMPDYLVKRIIQIFIEIRKKQDLIFTYFNE